MSTTPIRKPAHGETLLDMEPDLLQQVDPGWRHRMSLYTGRALTDVALSAEQVYRSGRLALLSQLVTPGVGRGLEASVLPDGRVQVTAGYGFTASGEDVTLTRDLIAPGLDALQVVDPVTAERQKAFADWKTDAAQKGRIMVMLLVPVAAKSEIVRGECVEVTGELANSATRDPDEYAFEDWQLVDGALLALAPWPTTPKQLMDAPPPTPAATWRNRIATTLYNAELSPDPADATAAYAPPWTGIGVAVGLAAFDATWKLLFFDRNAVVRSGGRSNRTELQTSAPGTGGTCFSASYAVAEARLLQVLEQNAQTPPPTNLSGFASLPPTAILPATVVDLMQKKPGWLPAQWSVRAAPIHAEEVETALRAMMFAAPFDLSRPEEATVLVPLTDDLYDPDVLITEVLAQVFLDEKKKATDARDAVLQHRKFVQQEANVLRQAAGQTPLDLGAGLSSDELTARDAATYKPADTSENYGTTKSGNTFTSDEITRLQTLASAAPYTNKVSGKTIPLFTADDMAVMSGAGGLPAFTDRINARIDKVEDAINLSFLQTQTNIYRYRTNVLKGTDASRLVTSPIIANIAERESATATAQDLSAYLESIGTPKTTKVVTERAKTTITAAKLDITPSVLTYANLGGLNVGPTIAREVSTISIEPTTSDVTSQLPMTGLPFNLRTLNIAERLKTSVSHEALQYSLSARTSFLDALLAADFGIAVDDLEILVHEQDSKNPGLLKITKYTISDLRVAAKRDEAYGKILNAGLPNNADESTVFSSGITTLDHHTLLLRAVEARIALYKQYLAEVATSLTSVSANAQAAAGAIARLDNALSDARGNLALVLGLINDEEVRIKKVNDRRTQTLQSVSFVVLTRSQTLDLDADVPSRQLVPADVASPVPAALQSTAIVPPELRELSGLLREAPAAWMPSIEALLEKLERSQHFLDIAAQMRARAAARLQTALPQSSAIGHPGPFGEAIADVFESQQTILTTFVQQRAAYDHVPLLNMSWMSQKAEIFRVAAINDLVASDAVHLEVAQQIASLVRDVAKIATALYLRVNAALPVARLQWAEYLRGAGKSATLRSLTILPGWDAQDYIDRQQMQMLVDWLFTQIDTNIPAAVAFVSDMVRTSILVASHAPVTDVIAGEIAARIKPAVGGLVTLTAASSRVAHGMPVLLYQDGELTARAVVDDMDTGQVYAKVTTVYKADTYLEKAGAHAQFLNDDPAGTLLTNASRALR